MLPAVMPRTLILLCAGLLIAGCAPPTTQTKATFAEGADERRLRFDRALANFYANFPTPFPCHPGAFGSEEGYVIAVAGFMDRAGLKLGDRIVSINDIAVQSRSDRARALYSGSVGRPLEYGVERPGSASVVKISAPCADDIRRWEAQQRFLMAAAQGDWQGCLEALIEVRNATGFLTPPAIWDRLECAKGRGRVSRGDEAQLVYDFTRVVVDQQRHVPGGLDNVRSLVLRNSQALQQMGFSSLAVDLEKQFHAAAGSVGVNVAPPASTPKRSVGLGTAFLIRPDGLLATAYHVIKDATNIEVVCPGAAPSSASVEVTAPRNDLAVLRIRSSGLSWVPLAKPRSPRRGDRVFTIGFPVAHILGDEAKFSDGAVASLSGFRGEASVLQITVPIQPGNSGGPLLNEEGDVIGVVTSMAAVQAFLKDTGTLPQNVNWAVKSEYLRLLVDEPEAPTPLGDRRQIVDRAIQSTCSVRAYR
jgi:S1-C subfamily serine protease